MLQPSLQAVAKDERNLTLPSSNLNIRVYRMKTLQKSTAAMPLAAMLAAHCIQSQPQAKASEATAAMSSLYARLGALTGVLRE